MCFKAPKMPKVPADPNYTIQRNAAEQDARDQKSENKQLRLEDALQLMSGRVGRASLFSGGAGGAGYAAPMARSLFVSQ